jgi:CheY-like chemotaxis protein
MFQRVLVVDDNRDIADGMRSLFKAIGIAVEIAYDGASALAICESWRPTDVFADLTMPGMDGYELARQLRDRFPDEPLRLIAMSGWGQEEHRAKARVAGFDDYLVKPVTGKSLLVALAR